MVRSMNRLEQIRDALTRTWTIVADTNAGRLYLNVRNGDQYGWSPKHWLGLRFHEADARAIADSMNTLHETGTCETLPAGALRAEALKGS